jgi:hypothetical protein
LVSFNAAGAKEKRQSFRRKLLADYSTEGRGATGIIVVIKMFSLERAGIVA